MSGKDKIKEKIKGSSVIGHMNAGNKKWIIGGLAAVVVIALAATIWLNVGKDKYEVLFPGASKEENAEMYTVLQARDIKTQRNTEGEVMVPEKEAGDIMLDMSALGYPKTALPFNIFSDNTGFTTTEFEKKQYLLLNLQDRLERTLKDMSGVKNAIVTLNVPDESNYVWEEQSSDSTGSVSLTFMPSFELSSDKVTAIKKLVSNSVPRLLPENVTVVNAETMQELMSDDLGTSTYGLNRLDFESKVEEKLENKIKNVLTLGYAASQIRVSATVVIDYDKMITEDLQYQPQENGQGVVDNFEERRTTDGTGNQAGGVAGEENNTDTPTYGAQTEDGNAQNTGDYYRNVDYLASYIKRQIEKDNVELQKATVAITVNDNNLTAAKKQQIIDSASKAANIAPEDIVVSSFQQAAGTTPLQADQSGAGTASILEKGLFYVIIGAAVVLALTVLIIALMARRRRKHAREDEELFGAIEEEIIPDQGMKEAAAGDAVVLNPMEPAAKEQTPVNRVKTFAKANPEIIASMISSWLKEGEQ